jgi:hypothetical protein
MEKAAHFPDGEHGAYLSSIIGHIFHHPLFSYRVTTIAYLTSPHNHPNGLIEKANSNGSNGLILAAIGHRLKVPDL